MVDDYADSRGAVRDLLEDHGYDVVEASNGQEALNFLVLNAVPSVQLIVLDLQMPIMNGWQFLTLHDSYFRLSKIPVVVVSAHSELPSQGLHKNVVGCLKVPYRIEELLALVEARCTPTKAPSIKSLVSRPLNEQTPASSTAEANDLSPSAIDAPQK